MITSRRLFLLGLGTALPPAPAIVRASSLMPVKALPSHDALMRLLENLKYAENGTIAWYSGYDTLNIEPHDPVLTPAEYKYVQLPCRLEFV